MLVLRKELKKYRKSNGLSKKKMSKKLGISLDKYKEIEKGGKIDEKFEAKIQKIVGTLQKDKLDKFLSRNDSLGHLFKNINLKTDPYRNIAKIASIPTLSTLTKTPSVNIWKSASPFSIDLLKDIGVPEGTGVDSWKNVLDQVSIKSAVSGQINALKGLQSVIGSTANNITPALELNKKLFDGLSNQSKAFDSIKYLEPFKVISKSIVQNKDLYNGFIGFSSELTSALSNATVSSTILPSYFSADKFLNPDSKITALDILFASTFSVIPNIKIEEDDLAVIERLKKDHKLREEANEFLSELNDAISDENIEVLDDERIDALFEKLTVWVSDNFEKKQPWSDKLGQILFSSLMFIIAILNLYNGVYGNKEESHAIRETLHVVKVLKEQIEEQATTDKEQVKLLEYVLDRLDSENAPRMLATQDVNLRKSNNGNSKILGVVKKSQTVVVLEKKRKWMEILYKEIGTNSPKTGWVYIDYFKSLEKH